jgi:hypothetical protein
MKISEVLIDSGDAEYAEDALFLRRCGKNIMAGVLDGVSGPYHPSSGPELFNGETGGQIIVNVAVGAMQEAANWNPDGIFNEANGKVREKLLSLGIARNLPGASFAFAWIDCTTKMLTIIQGGDSYALIELRGKIVATGNQVYEHDHRLLKAKEEFEQEFPNNRDKVWDKLVPLTAALQLKHVNNSHDPFGYASLNGQCEVLDCLNKMEFPLDNVLTLLLFTDGLVPFGIIGRERKARMFDSYKKVGLKGILKETRGKKFQRFTDGPEAVGIAIVF